MNLQTKIKHLEKLAFSTADCDKIAEARVVYHDLIKRWDEKRVRQKVAGDYGIAPHLLTVRATGELKKAEERFAVRPIRPDAEILPDVVREMKKKHNAPPDKLFEISVRDFPALDRDEIKRVINEIYGADTLA